MIMDLEQKFGRLEEENNNFKGLKDFNYKYFLLKEKLIKYKNKIKYKNSIINNLNKKLKII